jgi:ribosomal protein L7/L12
MVVKINGKEYIARPSLGNFKIFKDITGVSLLSEKQQKEMQDDFSEEKMAAYIHAFTSGKAAIDEIYELGIGEIKDLAETIGKMVKEDVEKRNVNPNVKKK